MNRYLDRLVAWSESLPETLRPAAYGGLVIVMFMLLRGAWLVVPIAVVYVLATSDTPLDDILLGAGVGGLAIVAGALSGLAYGLLGRRVRALRPGGRYLAGIVTIAPYMFVLVFIVRLGEQEPVLVPLTGEDVAIGSGMATLFGVVMGHTWFAPEKGTSAAGRRRRSRKRRRTT